MINAGELCQTDRVAGGGIEPLGDGLRIAKDMQLGTAALHLADGGLRLTYQLFTFEPAVGVATQTLTSITSQRMFQRRIATSTTQGQGTSVSKNTQG